MTDQHTPGPWKAVEVNHTDAWWQIVTDEYEPHYITDIKPSFPGDFPARFEANARLIASAPTMLEALRALKNAKLMRGASGPAKSFTMTFEDTGALELMDAAIAAATGEGVPAV